MESSFNNQIDFIVPNKIGPISLSVFDSDLISNAAVMEQVVGTLIKYSGIGRYEPYLAKKWSVSADQKTWSFEFYPNLKTEDNLLINADSFSTNLKKLLKIYSKQYSPPTFNRLKGWNKFINGDESAIGISVTAEGILKLSFETTPSGLLEFLSMPYFGFYSPADFDGENWRDKKIIHSSASYRVSHYSDTEIHLETRRDWPQLNPKAPEKIVIREALASHELDEKKNLIIKLINTDYDKYKGLIRYSSTPTLLSGIVLSPLAPPFNSLKIRQAFRTLIRSKAETIALKSIASQKTNYFYSSFSNLPIQSSDYAEAIKLLRSIDPGRIQVFQQKLTNDGDIEFVNSVLKIVIAELGWVVDIDTPETLGTDWLKKVRDNKKYAIRIARVDIGGSPENWVIDMMFCSQLGISFPDENQKVCAVVKDFDNGNFTEKSRYWEALHSVIEQSSTVVPLLHSGFSWLISSSIEMQNISSTMNIPRFDQLSIKK
jgi:hypothetical protein